MHEWDSNECEVVARGGMSLRDYFAAKAMQALLMQPNHIAVNHQDGTVTTYPHRMVIAPLAYEYADLMLAEREKP